MGKEEREIYELVIDVYDGDDDKVRQGINDFVYDA